jgi:hypothetical protein
VTFHHVRHECIVTYRSADLPSGFTPRCPPITRPHRKPRRGQGRLQLNISNPCFGHGILNSPYDCALRLWELDLQGSQLSASWRNGCAPGSSRPFRSRRNAKHPRNRPRSRSKKEKAEANAESLASLNSDTSRPFEQPNSSRIAVKVINHLRDEVMKVFRV